MLQLPKGIILVEIFQFFCLNIAVSHPDTNAVNMIFLRIDIRITLCLCQMYPDRFCDAFQLFISTLDFINDDVICFDDTIGSAFDHDIVVRCMPQIPQSDFGMVFAAHASLKHPVYAAPLLHCSIRTG